jgi:hypothetical protein
MDFTLQADAGLTNPLNSSHPPVAYGADVSAVLSMARVLALIGPALRLAVVAADGQLPDLLQLQSMQHRKGWQQMTSLNHGGHIHMNKDTQQDTCKGVCRDHGTAAAHMHEPTAR